MMRRSLFALTVIALFAGSVIGDTYLDNPRGSNDRLNEANTNRNNANRLFDSQNNAKGGYCWGPAMTYVEGSQLSVEWTAQHGCGNAKLYCNIVIQYMCSAATADPLERVRDGTTTDTIPDNEAGATQVDANGELQFGMHESYESYQACKTRNRNTGLFIADREEEGGLTEGDASSIYTRQNNNGNRHGYECPEERDYYPYWAPSQWRDVAILTQDTEYCGFYEANSQNVAEVGKCVDANGDLLAPNEPTTCAQESGKWQTVPAHGIAAPECVAAPWSRDNHLGSGISGYANTYNWTIPAAADLPCTAAGADGCNCVMRMRYNISTTDLDLTADDPAAQIDGNNPAGDAQSGPFLDWKYNGAASPFTDDQIVEGSGMTMQLALDTSQFGRTFQDRTHVFHIASRDGTNVPAGARVFNLNVRGKRGNIVQTYPSKEYDFVPEILYTRTGDYVHFQWTGCDTNPAGNAGEGTDQTDRSNIVQIAEIGANLPASDAWIAANTPLFEDPALRKRMAFLDQDPSVCLTQAELLAKNNNNENAAKQDVQNCMKLNAASQYFDGGIIQMNKTADNTPLMYMSSRNNNFSNRGQKAVIYVENLLPQWAIALTAIGGALFLVSAGLVGASFYAKSHPHSGIANIFNKM